MMRSANIVYQKLNGSYDPTDQECDLAKTRIDKFRCVCNHGLCKELMRELGRLAPDKARWMRFPPIKPV